MDQWQQPRADPPPDPAATTAYAEPIQYARVVRPQIERNWRGGLIAFGAVSILIGALLGCVPLMIAVALFVTRFGAPAAFLLQMLVAVAVYAAAATLFIWTGVGSIRCRRWVRPIVVGIGWPTIVASVLALAGWMLFARDFQPALGLSYAEAMQIAALGAAFMAFCGILVPGAFVWFYSTRAVRETLAAHDPGPSWTEARPLPLFVACVSLVPGALATLSLAPVGSVPFFGHYIEGAIAAVPIVVAAGVMIVAAVLMYRKAALGWWMALTVIVLGFTSALITLGRQGMFEFYKRGRPDEELLYLLEQSPTMLGFTPIVFVAIACAICVGYLVWVHRYFRGTGGVRGGPGEERAAVAYPEGS